MRRKWKWSGDTPQRGTPPRRGTGGRGPLTRTSQGLGKSKVHRNNAAPILLVPGTAFMLSRAQWYREQANLALQRGHETRDPTVRAGFDELVREWQTRRASRMDRGPAAAAASKTHHAPE